MKIIELVLGFVLFGVPIVLVFNYMWIVVSESFDIIEERRKLGGTKE